MPNYETDAHGSMDLNSGYEDSSPSSSGSKGGKKNLSSIIKLLVVLAILVVVVVFGAKAFSNFSSGGSSKETGVVETTEETEGSESTTGKGEGGLSVGSGSSYDNVILLETRAKEFGEALFTGDSEVVHSMLSSRCASSGIDTDQYVQTIYNSLGGNKINPDKDLTITIKDPRLGISFVTYKVKGVKNTFDTYFLWNGNDWVMDSCNR